MKTSQRIFGCATLAVVFAGAAPLKAQQISDTPGSPTATTTISGKQLPPPHPHGVERPELKPGRRNIRFDYTVDETGLGKSGKGVLYVDDQEVAKNSMEHGTLITSPEDETFDIGNDTRTGVHWSNIATILRSLSPARSTS